MNAELQKPWTFEAVLIHLVVFMVGKTPNGDLKQISNNIMIS